MPKLAPQEQIKADKQTLSAIMQNYGLKVRSFSVAGNGIENTTFITNTGSAKFALRVYRKNKKKTSNIAQELDFMLFLYNNGLPVPQVFPNIQNKLITQHKKDGTLWSCILMQLMPGSHSGIYSSKLIKDLAATQATMHKLGIAYAKKHSPSNKVSAKIADKEFLPKINLNKIKNPKFRQFLERDKRYALQLDKSLPHGFNHNDYDNENTLAINQRLSAILDFDDLSYSPVVLCLGYTLWDVYFESQNIKKMFLYLQEYQKTRKLSRKELSSLKAVMQFRNYVIGAAEMYFHGERRKYLPLFLKAEKIINKLSF